MVLISLNVLIKNYVLLFRIHGDDDRRIKELSNIMEEDMFVNGKRTNAVYILRFYQH